MKRLLSCILCFVLVLLISPKPVVTAIDDTSMTVEEMNNIHNEVRALLQKRSFYYMCENSRSDEAITAMSTSREKALEDIDDRLDELGVRRGTLAELGYADRSRSVDIPDTPNENWYLETYLGVMYYGVRYEVRVLTAQAANNNSDLLESGSKTLHAAPGIAAGVADYIRIVATAASGTVGSAFGSIYDAVSVTINNLRTSTVIEDVSAQYIWQASTMLHFAYVKKADSDFEERHTYTYNEASVMVQGTTIDISFNDGTPNDYSFSNYVENIESMVYINANNLQNAVDCFLNYSYVASAFVDCIELTGVGGKRIARYYPHQEVYPSWLF